MLIDLSDLPGPPDGRSFIGAEHGGLPISLFVVHGGPGVGPEFHRHPYAEVFVLDAGQAEFQVGDSLLTAHAGAIVIAPAGSPHRFTNTGDGQLRLTAIHTAPTMETEWLAPDAARTPASRTGPA